MIRLGFWLGLGAVSLLLIPVHAKPRSQCSQVGALKTAQLKADILKQTWEDYLSTRSDHSRNALAENYRHLIHFHAERIAEKLPADAPELGDLVNDGFFGLIDALEAFDPARGYKFETYSARRIRGAILDGLREWDNQPRLVRHRTRQRDAFVASLYQHLGRAPSDEEVRVELESHYGESLAGKIISDARADQWMRPIESAQRNFNPESSRQDESIHDASTFTPLQNSQTREFWHQMTKGLNRSERMIIILYYKEGLTLKEIGKVLELSESRVSQLHTSIKQRLAALHGSELHDLIAVAVGEDQI